MRTRECGQRFAGATTSSDKQRVDEGRGGRGRLTEGPFWERMRAKIEERLKGRNQIAEKRPQEQARMMEIFDRDNG